MRWRDAKQCKGKQAKAGSRDEPDKTDAQDAQQQAKRLLNATCSIALGIACRGGKISGQQVMDMPQNIRALADKLNANSVLIELLEPFAWLPPRKEPNGVSITCASVRACVCVVLLYVRLRASS